VSTLQKTVFYDRHKALGAKMVDFAGWNMPVQYPTGIVQEHLSTRRQAGLFDVAHMGRFAFRGEGALPFLQHVLTNNAEALGVGDIGAQYTVIPTSTGGAVDDAYLYRFEDHECLLVVNASNRNKVWQYLASVVKNFKDVEMTDRTAELAMLALQGPASRQIIEGLKDSGRLPEPVRNAVERVTLAGMEVDIARTGYTGEPLCFELFMKQEDGPDLWEQILRAGASPCGLGARDTLRLEAGLPLYGHELGTDMEGQEIPVLAVPIAKFAVSFSSLKGDFVGREALFRQFQALEGIIARDYSRREALPRLIRPVAVAGRGVAREGSRVFKEGRTVGYVTSGTMVPYWLFDGDDVRSRPGDEHAMRPICLAYLDCDILEDEPVSIDIRGKMVTATVVPHHLRSEAPPYARPIVSDHQRSDRVAPSGAVHTRLHKLLEDTLENTQWRQRECMNLIPSEMTLSPMARLVSVMDPAFRYAEHKESKAFYDEDIFFYQGTGFISEVERLLEAELAQFLGCREVEARLVSGQMANTAVFSALVDYVNRSDRRREPLRIRKVMNQNLGKGGHLSAQPMGALRDFVARDFRTERTAVIHFPVQEDNPYQVDVPAALELIDQERPELIIFGKSMVLHREPVADIRRFIEQQGLDALVMYDMAHVLGLIGPHFQQPFEEGAHLVTGSTHKTFFGTQRGVVGSVFEEQEERYELWEALRRRSFPGSVSNHHLGTLLGLLVAAYEMNHFKEDYQPRVIANAKAFATSLKDAGLQVAGDPERDFTETHQVVVMVGYARGAEIARKLEASNIICNYQAGPEEEGFTAAGALRLGVSEMTRFGMKEDDFRSLAQLMAEVIQKDAVVVDEVKELRKPFTELKFCFNDQQFEDILQKLHKLL
jgi:aminomethyltransferase